MKHIFRLSLSLMMAFTVTATWAQEKKDDLSQLSYPELEVTPLASERLEIEAKRERRMRWSEHWPIQVSSIALLATAGSASASEGASQVRKDRIDDAVSQGQVIGGAWLVSTMVLSAAYMPYRRGYFETAKLPEKTTREKLTRERLAEEALYAPGKLGRKLEWFSLATQLYASIPFISEGDDETKTMGVISALAAFLPVVFEYRWSAIADQHREYKKKIYGPVGGPVLIPEQNGRLAMGYGLSFRF